MIGLTLQSVATEPNVLPSGKASGPRIVTAARIVPGQLSRIFSSSGNYPEAAKNAGIDGLAVVDLVISKAGLVNECTVVEAPHESLGKTTYSLARKLNFIPAKDEHGKRVVGKFTLRFRWTSPSKG